MRKMMGMALVAPLAAGCFSTDLDPAALGAFACVRDADNDDCPDGLLCINQVCESEDAVPKVEVRAPESESDVRPEDIPDGGDFDITIAGDLTLVAVNSGGEHVTGEGHVAVFLDGEEVEVVDSGALSAGITVTVTISRDLAPHRIEVLARRNDGVDYDNPEALARRLFWITDNATPQVALVQPWPGDEFALDTQVIDVEVAFNNFVATGVDEMGANEIGTGHAHVHYDVSFPDCLDSACDDNYFAVVVDRQSGGAIPTSPEATANIVTILRNINHSVYRHLTADGPSEGIIITDTVSIQRIDR